MDPRDLLIKEFNYELPAGCIAKYPLDRRDASRLLIYKDGAITEDIYRNLAQHVPANSLLIFNDTKVIEARLLFTKNTGGVIEIFCLAPAEGVSDIQAGMMQRGRVAWQCLIGGASKWKHGQVLTKKIQGDNHEILFTAKFAGKKADCFIIEFSWPDDSMSFAEILHRCGEMPLPHYLRRAPEKTDKERYQTIYAHHEGSVAAPTAGLHFTAELFDQLKKKNIQTDFLTLHVGAGTFIPVKTERLGEHTMHTEFLSVPLETIQDIRKALEATIIPVGTTSLRAIESIYWLGVKLMSGQEELSIEQWEPYEQEDSPVSPDAALRSVIDFMGKKRLTHLTLQTQILIAPSYKTKIAGALITNFHLPQSTLLVLVAALTGADWRRIYDYALEHDFRFLSYGDGCLLWLSRSVQEPVK